MRLRLPFACQSGCALCAGAMAGDVDAVAATLEHAEEIGQRRAYLQGRDLPHDRHLPEILRAARRRSVQVSVVEEGNCLGFPEAARSLRQMGVDRVYVSLDGGAEGIREPDAASPEVRKQALAALLALSRDGDIAVGVHVPLTERSAREIPAVLRLQTRLSIRELLISEVLTEDGGLEALDTAAAVAALDRAWLAANRLQLRLRLIGFDRTRHSDPLPLGAPAPACDSTLLETIRRGIPLTSPRAGICARGTASQPSGLQQLAPSVEDLRTLGLELAARRCPFVDLPPCLGGARPTRASSSDGGAANFIKSEACPTCPFDGQCSGAPERLDGFPPSALHSALRPLPIWHSCRRPPRVLILSSQGQDRVFYKSTLPGLAETLRRRGVNVEIVSPWASRWDPEALPLFLKDIWFQRRWDKLIARVGGHPSAQQRSFAKQLRNVWEWVKAKVSNRDRWMPDWTGTTGIEAWLEKRDLSGFDLVITSDFPTAQLALAAPSLGAEARIVVLDFHMLKDMSDALTVWVAPSARAAEGGWWPSSQLILESGFPGYVKLYLNYGVPLEHVAWRPFPLYAGHFPPGPDVQECSVIMSGGNHLRDLETLRTATARLPSDVRPVVLFDQGKRFDGNAHLLHEGAVPLRSFYHALAHSRFVVVPLREDTHRAAGVTVLAMALMAGRPVVATGIAAVRDYVQHGVEGLLVPPGDSTALADAITRLDRDAALLSTLAAGARGAGRRLSTDSWAEQIVSGAPALGPTWTDQGWRNW